MKKQFIAIGAMVLLVCITLSGCNQGNNPSDGQGNNTSPSEAMTFVGTWVNITTNGLVTAMNFFSDNTSVIDTLSGRWGAINGKLAITLNGGYPASFLIYTYVFSNNNSTLALTPSGGQGAQIFTKRIVSANGEKNDFIGTWRNISTSGTTTTMNFFSYGSSSINARTSTWDVKDERLVVQLDANTSWVYIYAFSDNYSTLSLTSTMGGITQVFTKE